jgi:hypothetical protein
MKDIIVTHPKWGCGRKAITKLGVLLAAAAACTLLPSVSQATCFAVGTIPRVTIGTASATVAVRSNSAGSTTYLYSTTNANFLNAALIAEASHMNVSINGNASSCGAVSGGQSQGGSIVAFQISP